MNVSSKRLWGGFAIVTTATFPVKLKPICSAGLSSVTRSPLGKCIQLLTLDQMCLPEQ